MGLYHSDDRWLWSAQTVQYLVHSLFYYYYFYFFVIKFFIIFLFAY